MAQKKETAVVYSQEELAPGIFSMWIVTDIADEARPGQFISVYRSVKCIDIASELYRFRDKCILAACTTHSALRMLSASRRKNFIPCSSTIAIIVSDNCLISSDRKSVV